MKIAVARNFTKGRRTEQVQASCLYLACRYDILSSIIFALWFLDMGMVVSTVDTDIIVGSQNMRMQQKGHQFAYTRWELLRLEGDDREFLEKVCRKELRR